MLLTSHRAGRTDTPLDSPLRLCHRGLSRITGTGVYRIQNQSTAGQILPATWYCCRRFPQAAWLTGLWSWGTGEDVVKRKPMASSKLVDDEVLPRSGSDPAPDRSDLESDRRTTASAHNNDKFDGWYHCAQGLEQKCGRYR